VLSGAQPQTFNKESEVDKLLDENGQIQLRNPLNIFIGGNILDRGITIDNVIGFFYGRNPKRSQQDTVLQHARMYGARAQDDLAVTRFYTTADIYDRMDRIHQFDSALRTALENGGQNQGVVFIQRDQQNQIAPCSPNKILLSNLTTLRPGGRLIPSGFTTTAGATAAVAAIDALLLAANANPNQELYTLPLATVEQIITHIESSIEMDTWREFDFDAMRAAAGYLSNNNPEVDQRGEVAVLVRRNRNLVKVRTDGRLQNAPERQQDQDAIQPIRGRRPVLFLFRANGAAADGWSDQPFYWPVLVSPAGIQPVIFTAEVDD
jgi:hypothetical protein